MSYPLGYFLLSNVMRMKNLGKCCKIWQAVHFACTVFKVISYSDLRGKGKRLKPLSMASQWFWEHSIRTLDYFRNIPRKIWRMIYPAKEFISALSCILILTGTLFLHILKECHIAVSFKYHFQDILKYPFHLSEFCYLWDNY